MNCQACFKGHKGFCEYEQPGQEEWELYGATYKGCPFKIITKQSGTYLKAYKYYREGYLPNEGGWLSQPAKFLDALEIIERELKNIEYERVKKRERFRK